MIVDSPGFGEHGRKSSQVERYLVKSFGAIYLVNTAAAGGVNSGRVCIKIYLICNNLFQQAKTSMGLIADLRNIS